MKTVEPMEAREYEVREGTNVRHFTVVVERHTFTDGKYAGLAYRITSYYVSNAPGHRGQFLKSSSEPWK
jgi:hypothetical protein